jgi:serine phosphatase RsbU (regulator of sigma subunit)
MYSSQYEKDVADSIKYASYIQNAMMPDPDEFGKLLPDSFIMYKPRDTVSGDFYWIARIGERIAVAAVDCTGHGVPGAFMSIMGINFLNQVVSQCIPASNKLLNQLREHVMKALHQKGSEDDQKDGMDMALCVIDLEKKQVEFSGANNPLIYFHREELVVIKGDRMPIGVSPVEEQSFTRHVIPFSQVDTLYIFSDGYSDQFGGYRYKKLKFKGFKRVLRDASRLNFKTQKDFLNTEFLKWKGKYEQIDDILVIGIGLEHFK